MQKQNTGGLSTEELKSYPGFEKMNQNQLEEALLFIEQMAEILNQII
jgi:hypothetical protein